MRLDGIEERGGTGILTPHELLLSWDGRDVALLLARLLFRNDENAVVGKRIGADSLRGHVGVCGRLRVGGRHQWGMRSFST